MTEPATNHQTEQEIKEISLLKRNARLLRRMLLGKKRPNAFTRVICWLFMIWDFLLIIGNVLLTFFDKIMVYAGDDTTVGNDVPPRFYLTYALLHAISFIGVALMWRNKRTGFFIFTLVNLLMPFWKFFITQEWEFMWWVMIFSLASICLFAINWNRFDANVRKREKLKAMQK